MQARKIYTAPALDIGNGTGGFGTKTDFATGAGPRTVAIGDVSGDGLPDLAVVAQGITSVSVRVVKRCPFLRRSSRSSPAL